MKKYLIYIYTFFILASINTSINTCFAADRVVVSVVLSSDIEPYQQTWEGFQEFFKEKGTAIWSSVYNLKKKDPNEIFRQIKKERPDIVFTLGTKATKLAKKEITEIPIIFSMVINAEALVSSNATGVSMDIPVAMKIKHLKKILPRVKKVGMVYSSQTKKHYREALKICQELNYILVSKEIKTAKEFPEALEDIYWQIDYFLMVPDSNIYFLQAIKHLLSESIKNKFPVIGLSSRYINSGALVSYDCDYRDIGRQTGEIALRVLAKEEPQKVKPVFARKFKFSLNLLTAERIGIKLPSNILKEASEVYGK